MEQTVASSHHKVEDTELTVVVGMYLVAGSQGLQVVLENLPELPNGAEHLNCDDDNFVGCNLIEVMV